MVKHLLEKRMLLHCGTGGVGKTTVSAALALRACLEGKRVGLITIDPARRLAASLGLTELGSEPRSLDRHLARELPSRPKGSLSALMLHSQDTLNKFLLEVGGTEVQKKFLESNLYQVISDNFSGTHDYLALEKLFELHESGKFDLIILDTPPARHTLDFLNAPDRIARFFDDRIFQWFLVDPRDSSIREKLRARGTRAALGLLEKITGSGVIHDFVTLAPYFQKVKNAFVERQSSVRRLIRSNEAGAVFISSPNDLARGEAVPFLDDARRQGVNVLAFVLNRSLAHVAPEPAPRQPGGTPRKLWENYRNLRYLVEEEQGNFQRLRELAGGSAGCFSLPEMETDVHDVRGLHELAKFF
ncbi:MAG: ArsA family ATPase [Bdellovibrionales bacterium]|nr:ArsA family ATPase [Bdellovibrionales bacterium]